MPSNVLSEALTARGARVIGRDGSSRMLELASARLGDTVERHHHDLNAHRLRADGRGGRSGGLLVLPYVEHWRPVLAELHRSYRPGGGCWLTHHPFQDLVAFDRPDYFAVEQLGDQWSKSGASGRCGAGGVG